MLSQLDVSQLSNFLQTISPIAVIAGASLVVFQLRHSAREIKSNIGHSAYSRG